LAEHVFFSVRRSAADHLPPHPLLSEPRFYVQMLDDLVGVVLTSVGFALLGLGLLHPAWRRYLPWLAAMAVVIVALPRKFFEMNYYWMAVLPALGMMVGLGWQVFIDRVRPGRMAVAGVVAVAMLLAAREAARPAFITPTEDRAVREAARAIQRLTEPDEPIVTVHGTGISLLYYADRPGWPARAGDIGGPNGAEQLDRHRRAGARMVVSLDGPLPGLGQPVASGKDYRVYALENASN
jgi:hypothetical protein